MDPDISERLTVRDAVDSDLVAVQRIYAHYVLGGLASFEEVPPTVDELRERRTTIARKGLPYIVAETGGRIVGYAYASTYRPRPAYRYTAEDSVYVADGFHGRGIGRALLTALIARCEASSCRQLVAIIGDSANEASIALHRSMGFRHVGTLRGVGFKLGRWVDSVVMQRALGPGDSAPPAVSDPTASRP